MHSRDEDEEMSTTHGGCGHIFQLFNQIDNEADT
jgi:hypothetical protein